MITVYYIASERAHKRQFTEDPKEIPYWDGSNKLTFDRNEDFRIFATLEEAKINFRSFAEKFRNDKAYIGTININEGELYKLVTDMVPVKKVEQE